MDDSSSLLSIYAIAVASADTLERSDVVYLPYQINSLPQASKPYSSPETGSTPTELSNGALITLASDTIGTDIYYTTDGTLPLPAAYLEREEWSKPLKPTGIPLVEADPRYYIVHGVCAAKNLKLVRHSFIMLPDGLPWLRPARTTALSWSQSLTTSIRLRNFQTVRRRG